MALRTYKGKKYDTLLGPERLEHIDNATIVIKREGLLGSTAEVGVHMGGTSRFIAEQLPDKVHLAFDSFDGLQDVSKELGDQHRNGNFKLTDEEKNSVIKYLNLPNIRVLVGIFPDTAADYSNRRFCLVHCDVDTYKSTMSVLQFFYHRLVIGGFLFVDDYDAPRCQGARRAVDEFTDENELDFEMTSSPQCLIRRT